MVSHPSERVKPIKNVIWKNIGPTFRTIHMLCEVVSGNKRDIWIWVFGIKDRFYLAQDILCNVFQNLFFGWSRISVVKFFLGPCISRMLKTFWWSQMMPFWWCRKILSRNESDSIVFFSVMTPLFWVRKVCKVHKVYKEICGLAELPIFLIFWKWTKNSQI